MARNKYPEQTVKRIVEAASRLFNEKGYEQTTIQDIINELGDLSKGAIYHHFRSKQEILEAMYEANGSFFQQIIAEISGDTTLNGLQKLQTLLMRSVTSPVQTKLHSIHPDVLKDSRILGDQTKRDIALTAPVLRRFLEEGIADGSVTATDPEPLSEVLMLLTNVWLNAIFLDASLEQVRMRFRYLQRLTVQLGAPLFPDDKLLDYMEQLTLLFRSPAPPEQPVNPSLNH